MRAVLLALALAACGSSPPEPGCAPLIDGPCAALETKAFCSFTCTCLRAGTWVRDGQCYRR